MSGTAPPRLPGTPHVTHATLRVVPESLGAELGRVAPDTVFGVIVTDVSSDRFGEDAGMNIGEDQGRFLQLLVELTGAVDAVEVGTFTGMSALWIARALPDNTVA